MIRPVAMLALLGLLLAPIEAEGYLYYESSQGKPVRWSPCVDSLGFYIDVGGTPDIEGSREFDIILEMMDHWNALSCSDFHLVHLGNIDNAVAQAGIGEAENHVVFVENAWTHKATQVALTTLTYTPSTGYISDADLEFNMDLFDFALCDAEDAQEFDVDFRYVVLHESGHLFGLNHPPVDVDDPNPLPVMHVHNVFCENTPPHELTQDDKDGYCSYYGSVEFLNGCVTPVDPEPDGVTQDVVDDTNDAGMASDTVVGEPDSVGDPAPSCSASPGTSGSTGMNGLTILLWVATLFWWLGHQHRRLKPEPESNSV